MCFKQQVFPDGLDVFQSFRLPLPVCSLGFVRTMDIYFYLHNVTDLPLYNCSALTEEMLIALRADRRPLRGIACIIFGFSMILIYIACLRVMVKLSLIRNSCYKIMYVLGHFEMTVVFMNDIFIGYILTFGLAFCDAPNIIYIMGCIHIMCWAGATFLCLYLAFNRVLEILKLRRELIDFFFSPCRTVFGILCGIMYSLLFLFFITPPVYSSLAATLIPNPLDFEIVPSMQIRNGLIVSNNYGVVSATCVLYGFFFFSIRKTFQDLGFQDRQNRLHYQVFIQSVLLCTINFCLTSSYTLFEILDQKSIIIRTAYFIYQFSSGLQAMVYLLCNQTIFDGVKEDLFGLLKVKPDATSTDTRTKSTTSTVHPEIDATYPHNVR